MIREEKSYGRTGIRNRPARAFPQPRLAFDIERRTVIRSIIEPILREKHRMISFNYFEPLLYKGK